MTDLAVGLMSGTSLDGIDAALVRIGGRHDIELIAFHTVPFDAATRRAILAAIAGGSTRDVARLHVDLGHRFADAALALLERSGVSPTTVALCGSHGLTLWHEPRCATLQIGDPAVIAERLGVKVVSGFRNRDVAAGGEGAPLVPIADVMLFGHPDRPRALLNLGGMANVTFVPRRGSTDGVLAFDTGPGVAVYDAIVRNATGEPFDRDGRLAAAGVAADDVADEILQHPFFLQAPPKSTGREIFSDEFADQLVRKVREGQSAATVEDCTATAILVSCRAVARALRTWISVPAAAELVVSGGGARNPAFMATLGRECADWKLLAFDELFFDNDAKEAAVFAFLGWLTVTGQPGNVPTATGAAGPRILGHVTPA